MEVMKSKHIHLYHAFILKTITNQTPWYSICGPIKGFVLALSTSSHLNMWQNMQSIGDQEKMMLLQL